MSDLALFGMGMLAGVPIGIIAHYWLMDYAIRRKLWRELRSSRPTLEED